MKTPYTDAITLGKEQGGILDAMLNVQKVEGYLPEAAMKEIAQAYDLTPARVYETASFYSMVRLEKKARVQVEICRSAPCHVAGAPALIDVVEGMLGIKAGETSEDGAYAFGYVECLGQCQDAPTMLINGKLYNKLTISKVKEILKKEGVKG